MNEWTGEAAAWCAVSLLFPVCLVLGWALHRTLGLVDEIEVELAAERRANRKADNGRGEVGSG